MCTENSDFVMIGKGKRREAGDCRYAFKDRVRMKEKRNGKKYRCTGYLCMAAVCVVLSGCAANGKEQQEEYKQQGIVAMASGEYEQALELFQQALDLSGGSVGTQEIDICYYKAAALYRAGRAQEAVEVYDALTQYDDKNADACFLRGSIYAGQRDLESALEDYRQAVERDDENYDLYIGIYENLNALGYQEEAAEFLNMALEIEGDSAYNCLNRGRIYIILGQYDAAEKALLKAVDKKEDEARVYLAQIYTLQQDTDSAKEMVDAYLNSRNISSEGLTLLGNMAMDAQNYSQALEYYQQGLACAEVTNSQELRKNEIAAMERCGQLEEAQAKLAEYLQDYPGDQVALQEQQFLTR